MTTAAWIWLTVLGGVGAVARSRVDAWVGRVLRGAFPVGTLAVNASGTFALGVLTGAGVTGPALFVFGTGLIGAYTTFSTWMFETAQLAEDGETRAAAINLAASIAVGLAAAGAGWTAGSLL